MAPHEKAPNALLSPSSKSLQQEFFALVRDNPLPDELKRSVLEELLGGHPGAAQWLQAAGLSECPSRALTAHEAATIEAITGRAADVGARTLLDAVRRTRGDELMAWADLAAAATQARAGGWA